MLAGPAHARDARRCRYSHGLIRRLKTVTDREGVVLSSGACIGMPPAVGCPVTHLNDIGASSRAALAVRLGAEGIEALSRPVTTRNRDGRHRVVVDAATAHVTVTADLDSVTANVIAALVKRCRTVLTERCRYITKYEVANRGC